jgi:hypothetical protein
MQMGNPDAGKNSGRAKSRLQKKIKDYKKNIDEVFLTSSFILHYFILHSLIRQMIIIFLVLLF